MKIVCNGKDREVRQGISVEEFILELDLSPDTVVVELDGRIVLREDYQAEVLRDGSVMELIRFVGGG